MKRIMRKQPDVEIEFTFKQNAEAREIMNEIEKIKKDHPDLRIRAVLRHYWLN